MMQFQTLGENFFKKQGKKQKRTKDLVQNEN